MAAEDLTPFPGASEYPLPGMQGWGLGRGGVMVSALLATACSIHGDIGERDRMDGKQLLWRRLVFPFQHRSPSYLKLHTSRHELK